LEVGTSLVIYLLDFFPTEPHVQKYFGAKLPSSYLELKKAVHKVRRPYHARALVAVGQARELAGHFSGLPAKDQTFAKVQTFEECVTVIIALDLNA
jgi:hypothetical protein